MKKTAIFSLLPLFICRDEDTQVIFIRFGEYILPTFFNACKSHVCILHVNSTERHTALKGYKVHSVDLAI